MPDGTIEVIPHLRHTLIADAMPIAVHNKENGGQPEQNVPCDQLAGPSHGSVAICNDTVVHQVPTTCHDFLTPAEDVVYALAHATAQTGRFTLIERWRSNERLLAPHESPATVLMKWGEYAPEVQFILRRSMSPCNKTLASLDAYGTHGMRFNSVSDHSAQTIKIGQVHDDATTTIPILNSDTEQGALARDCDIRKSVTFNEPYGYDTNSNVEAQSENVVVIQPAPQSKARASCVRKSTHKNIQSTTGPLSSGGSILYFPHKKVRELPPYREPPGLLSPVRTLPPYREPPPPNSNSPNRLQFQGDSNSAGVTHHKENLSSPRNSTRSKRILVQEFHEIKGMSQFSCSVGGQPACMMSVAYTQRYVELIRLVNRQRDTINAQQADLTKCDAEILYWESKNREQTHHMDFISQEVNRIESTGRIIEEQLKDLAHIEEESEIVRQQEKTLKSEITLLRSKLANCETELLQCKNKMRLVMEELALEQHSMGRQLDERKIAECKMIGELERLQEEVEHAQQSTDSTCQCAEALKFDISNLETVIIEKKMQVERLVTDMKEANLQSLTVASQDDQVKHMMEGVSFTEGFYLCAMGPFVAQGFAALVGSLAILDAGMIYGWPTSSLPKLLHQQSEWDDESEMKITSEEGSWVVSISVFASILGPALLKLAVDRIGRRWSLSGIVLIMLISWLAIGLARGVEVLYVGRFIGGLAVGAAFPVTSMYLGEIADDQIRGILGSVLTVSLVLGQLLTVCASPWISRPMLSIFSSTPLIIFLIAFPWMPETAYFWLIKGDRERASASLVWLRQRADVTEELRTLQILVNEEQKNRDGSDTARLFRIRSNRRAFFIAIGLITFQQLSGAQAITAYAGIIFEESGLTGWTNWSMIIMGAFALLAALSTLFAIDAAGRRPILMLSAFFTVLFLLCEAIFFHLKYLGYDTSSFAWIPLFGLVGFHLSVYPGLGGIPWLMVGELFPTDVKAIAAILLGTYGSLAGFLVAKLYEPMGSAFGIHSVYYVFAIFTCSGLFFIYFIVPETKKRSFEDIQNLLNTGSSEKLKKAAKI